MPATYKKKYRETRTFPQYFTINIEESSAASGGTYDLFSTAGEIQERVPSSLSRLPFSALFPRCHLQRKYRHRQDGSVHSALEDISLPSRHQRLFSKIFEQMARRKGNVIPNRQGYQLRLSFFFTADEHKVRKLEKVYPDDEALVGKELLRPEGRLREARGQEPHREHGVLSGARKQKRRRSRGTQSRPDVQSRSLSALRL